MVYYCGGELYHYGVMGMHWGIRRYQPYPAGHTGGKEVGQAARVKKKKYVYPSADINSMSNDQLRRKVNRMRLESRYADMSTQKYVAERKAQKVMGTVSKGKRVGDDKIRKKIVGAVSDENVSKVENGLKKVGIDKEFTKKEVKSARKVAGDVAGAAGKVFKGVGAVNDLTKSAQRINRVDYRNEKMHEATKMSYKELQAKVDRMDMERQYSELKNSAYTTKGKQALEELIPILVASGAIVGGVKGGKTAVTAVKKLIK